MPDNIKRDVKLVRVVWEDARQESGWMTPDELGSLTTVRVVSVGWLLVDCPTHVTLAMDFHADDGMYAGAGVIPRDMIKDIEIL